MTGPQIIQCEQGSPEWFAARRGVPTASMFKAILAKGEGKTRKSYMLLLAAEIITGDPAETFQSAAMERGKQMEEEARDLYAFRHNVDLQRVGFIVNGRMGASPDSLIAHDGGLEIKTQRADLMAETILADRFPSEHKAQVQGNLMVTEREWWDLSVYWPKMPRFVKRAVRDEDYISHLRGEVHRFTDELDELVETIRRYGSARAA